ncbi:MAG: carbohydrate kinase [Patescibacteria group bacterium]
MKALLFGEIVWDVIKNKEYLGGALLNMAAHIFRLGGESFLISAVGKDQRGNKALKLIKQIGLDDIYIKKLKYPTGWVDVWLDKKGVPDFVINKDVAYDYIKLNQAELSSLEKENFDVFCFGTLIQRNKISRDSLYNILGKVKAKEVFYDVNLRQDFYNKEIISQSLEYSTIVKLNDEEIKKMSMLLFSDSLTEEEAVEKLFNNFKIKVVIITKGAKGCTVYTSASTVNLPGIRVKVKDTIGAGDAFSAGFLHKYFFTNDIAESAKFANKLGAYVASQAGAIPEYSQELVKKLG